MRLAALLLAGALLAAAEQPVLLPLPELMKALDPAREWLLLPQADVQALESAAKLAPAPPASGAFLASASVRARVVDGREVVFTADFTACNRGDGPALAALFAAAPARLGAISLGGQPAVLAPGAPLRLLLPRAGRFAGTLGWSVPLDGDIQRRGARLPLPLAGGLSLQLAGDGRGTAVAPGLVRDGDGWRLAAPAGAALDLAWLPGGSGDGDAPLFGAEQTLTVQMQDGPRPLRWEVRLEARRGSAPATLLVTLPPGFTCTAAQAGVAQLAATAEGLAITRAADAPLIAIDGLLAPGAPVALPRIAGAAWQGGTVALAGDRALACDPPAGWRTRGGSATVRSFAVAGPDAGMAVTPLAADAGLAVATSTAVAVGPQRATLDQVLTVRAGGTRLFRLPLQLPAGWRATALRGEGALVPAVEDLAPGAALAVELPGGLAPGAELSLLLTAEGAAARLPPALPAQVPGAARASHRMLVAAAPGIALDLAAPGWRLLTGEPPPAGVRAELVGEGEAAPVALAAAPRAAAVDVDVVAWLLPGADAAWCRCDLRLAVREGELARLELDLPLRRDGDLRVAGDGLVLEGDGPFIVSAPRPWRGERLLRIEGRLRPEATGRLPRPAARLAGAARAPLVRAWAALQAPGERDLQLAAGPAARPIDADELPAWAQAIPGAPVVAAWRLGDGDAGGWRVADRALAPLPDGFIDALDLATQVALGGSRTRLSCRLAAAGLAELDLGLPDGAVLEQAALDGAPAAVRRDGGRLLLALPGRTLVALVLRISTASGDRLELPRLGGLPVTRSAWTVAVDPALRAQPLGAPDLMPFAAQGQLPRPWLGRWTATASSKLVGPAAELVTVDAAAADPRALAPPAAPAAPAAEPALALHGQFFAGTRVGAPAAAAFRLAELDGLQRADAIGHLLALLLGLAAALAPRAWLRLLVPAALAAIPLTAALLAWQVAAGPLLALCEWLPFAVGIALAARWLRPTPALAAALLLLAGPLGAAEATGAGVRLMGYSRLDAQGVPQEVVVALPRDRFDALWARAHGPVKPPGPPVALAVGAPSVLLSLEGEAVAGRLELPVAVPGADWQELRLPLPGAVRSLALLPLGAEAPAPRQVAWSVAGGALVLRLEGGQQALVVVDFQLPSSESAGGRRTALALAPGLGGRLRLVAPAPWRAVAPGLALEGDAADLPTAGATLALGWDLPVGAAPVDGRLAAVQRLALRLEPGRLAWSAELELASAGAPLATARVVLPAGLLLAEVAGDGLAGWRQGEGVVTVAWTGAEPVRRLRLAGVVPRSGGGGRAAVALAVPGAAVSRGRLGLAAGDGERFLRPEGAALANAQPEADEALAVRWDDQPRELAVAWEDAARDLVLQRTLAVVVGEGRARASAQLTLSGRGAADALRLALPAPWRVAAVEGAVRWAVDGEGAARALVLAAAAPWSAGAVVALRLEADRAALGASPALPLLAPQGAGLAAGRLRLAVADAGAARAQLDAGGARALAPEQVAQELARGALLAAGERWRAAAELPAGAAPTLRLADDALQAAVTLSHYLILGRDGVRWSLHLAAEPDQGALRSLDLALPAGARLVAVAGPGLGGWKQDGQRLHLAWAAPSAAALAVDLELDLPAGADGALRLAAPVVEGVRVRQQIALVEEDDLGLVRREPDGLAELEQPIARLPDGVARQQVRWLWSAARADWSLRLAREALAATGGADGLATLVDGAVTVAPDGELRGSACWHVVNRTRQQLPLLLPAGVELWEARVDGQAVRVRRDAGGALWLPTPPLRPGQASTRIVLTWRSAAQPGGRLRFAPPALGELRLIASSWRLAAPAGWSLARRDGSLREADAVDAAADRAQAVIDEIQRLQAVDGLNESGLKRLEGQLAVLDSELKDHLATIGRGARPLRDAGASWSLASKVDSTSQAIGENRQRLGDLQRSIGNAFGNRAERRKQLNLAAMNQRWEGGAQVQQAATVRPGALDQPARLVPAAWPWDEALAPAAAGGLGAGQAPPGLAAGPGAVLSGIALVEEPAAAQLVLRGQGAALDAELELTPPRGGALGWIALGLAGLVLAGGALALRRR